MRKIFPGLLLMTAWLLTGCWVSEPKRINLVPPMANTVTSVSVQGEDRVLRVFIHDKGFPPLDFGWTPGKSSTGIYPEILDALCKKTGMTWVPIALPPGRVYEGFRSRDNNVEIGCNPQWRTTEADISLYTKPFTTDSNVLVFRRNARFPLPGPGDKLSGPPKIIGTIIGYVYPGLEEQFKTGALVRQDIAAEKTLLEVLAAGRVDAIIITRLVVLYYMKGGAYDFELGEPRDELPLSIRVHTSLGWAVAPLNRALDELRADGTIDKIYAKYR